MNEFQKMFYDYLSSAMYSDDYLLDKVSLYKKVFALNKDTISKFVYDIQCALWNSGNYSMQSVINFKAFYDRKWDVNSVIESLGAVIIRYLYSQFDIEFSNQDKSFLMFYGRKDTGEVIDFSWDIDYDYLNEKDDIVSNIINTCMKEV